MAALPHRRTNSAISAMSSPNRCQTQDPRNLKEDAWANFSICSNSRLVWPERRRHKKIEGKFSQFKLLANECMEQLYDDAPDNKFGAIGFLSFARLHHLNLHYFEVELTRELKDLENEENTGETQIFKIRKLLREYNEAIKDYERVLRRNRQPPKGILTSFHKALLPHLEELINKSAYTWDNDYIYLPTITQWANELLGRILGALFGGLALITPMLIMAINASQTKSLITASLATIVMALVVASVASGPDSWKDVVGITAAYAAVLVVFVGTSTGTSTSSS
ncbi:uncharacterized protein A1O5_11153 [Cladophialophora psammophila CBS 110553]|uniref:Uncharacterized protein n=1 Tax=Cladophialophora psammophila CBS 110553 TaxID=1182543 RepID=W9WLV1_9EURO|nr:uncharacterized protein A1O5_11153 [Cladophialophora psammophila CBS 110553]EXJ65626.1 hypothetical protein A1O5_11153 [Cladophialophora psammophila CBS 110553]